MTFAVFSRRVVLRGSVVLLSGLHVGSGRALGPAASDLPVMRDARGYPFIPGSSLKGVLRSTVEALLRGLKPGLACQPLKGDQLCISPNQMEEWRQQVVQGHLTWAQLDEKVWQKSCWVCRAFGSPWLASKLYFPDLLVSSPWAPELLTVRDGVAIDRETETAAAGLKFDFEVVPPGTAFGLEVYAENPEDYELGMLAVGIDMLNEGLAFLGGHKSRGLGRVRVEVREIEEWTPQAVLSRLGGKGPGPAGPETEPPEGADHGEGRGSAGPNPEEMLGRWRKALQEALKDGR